MSKIAELWAKKVMSGDKTYAEVPAQLKSDVDAYFAEVGYTPNKATLKKS